MKLHYKHTCNYCRYCNSMHIKKNVEKVPVNSLLLFKMMQKWTKIIKINNHIQIHVHVHVLRFEIFLFEKNVLTFCCQRDFYTNCYVQPMPLYRETSHTCILPVGGLELTLEGGTEELRAGLDLGGMVDSLLLCWGEGWLCLSPGNAWLDCGLTPWDLVWSGLTLGDTWLQPLVGWLTWGDICWPLCLLYCSCTIVLA